MVGIPSGLFSVLLLALGIHTRRIGSALYFLQFCRSILIASNLSASVLHKVLSTPLVFPPLLVTVFRTAIALAEKDIRISLCIRLISCQLTLVIRASYSLACSLFSSTEAFFQLMFFQLVTFTCFIGLIFSMILFDVFTFFHCFYGILHPTSGSMISLSINSHYMLCLPYHQVCTLSRCTLVLCVSLQNTIRFLVYSFTHWSR